MDPELLLSKNFQLIELIAMGAISRVYSAVHKTTGERFAVKVIQLGGSASCTMSRIEREWRVLRSLHHPNIVQGHSFDAVGRMVCIVMDLVQGDNLERLVRQNGAVSPRRAAEIIMQAARGLNCAHRAGIVHRDVKPSNLLIDGATGITKVIDFGMARIEWPGEEAITLEHDEALLGTVNFMAPEQAMACHDVDGRADIYALGCTMYFLLTGRVPFPEGSLAVRLQKHREEAPRPIKDLAPDVPREISAICDRMMEKSPANRQDTASELATTLGAWLAQSA